MVDYRRLVLAHTYTISAEDTPAGLKIKPVGVSFHARWYFFFHANTKHTHTPLPAVAPWHAPWKAPVLVVKPTISQTKRPKANRPLSKRQLNDGGKGGLAGTRHNKGLRSRSRPLFRCAAHAAHYLRGPGFCKAGGRECKMNNGPGAAKRQAVPSTEPTPGGEGVQIKGLMIVYIDHAGTVRGKGKVTGTAAAKDTERFRVKW